MPEYVGTIRALAWAEEIFGSIAASPQVMRARETASFLQELGSILVPGEPLEAATRSRMETFFGYDLKDVRVHRGPAAEELSRRLNARAFTLGRDIFGSRQNLDFSTSEGQGLLAHELTHTIQQTRPQPKAEQVSHGSGVGRITPAEISQEMVLAPAQSPISQQQSEVEAEASERLAAEVQPHEVGPLRIDAGEIAERVYLLMRNDLVLERERSGSLGG